MLIAAVVKRSAAGTSASASMKLIATVARTSCHDLSCMIRLLFLTSSPVEFDRFRTSLANDNGTREFVVPALLSLVEGDPQNAETERDAGKKIAKISPDQLPYACC